MCRAKNGQNFDRFATRNTSESTAVYLVQISRYNRCTRLLTFPILPPHKTVPFSIEYCCVSNQLFQLKITPKCSQGFLLSVNVEIISKLYLTSCKSGQNQTTQISRTSSAPRFWDEVWAKCSGPILVSPPSLDQPSQKCFHLSNGRDYVVPLKLLNRPNRWRNKVFKVTFRTFCRKIWRNSSKIVFFLKENLEERL